MIERVIDRWVALTPHARLFIIVFVASFAFLSVVGLTAESPLWSAIVAASWAGSAAFMLWLSNLLKARQAERRRRR